MGNKYIVFIAVAFLAIINFSCNKARETVKAQEYIETLCGDVYQLATTPMELLTDEQFNVAKKFAMIAKTSIILDGNKLVNTSTPEDFEKLGIPIYYYYVLNEIVNTSYITTDVEIIYNDLMRSIDYFLEQNKNRIAKMGD